MSLSFSEFLYQLSANPVLKISVFLILGVILVNGWTDAPNAIATCVGTGAMKLKPAIRMAAVFNFVGLFVMTAANSRVASTIYNMVDFGGDARKALTALCAAMTAIIVWSAVAWRFGIPTSESHALIAGLSGAAIAIQNGISGINKEEWMKVLYGLLLSVLFGFLLGWIGGKIAQYSQKQKNEKLLDAAQIKGAAAMAFMHGAQDGQKFMGVFLLGISLVNGKSNLTSFKVPFWMIFLCSIIMAAGTSLGGKRIIQTVGSDMVQLDKKQGVAADFASAACLFFSTAVGIPVSTTHVKTTAIMGVGTADRKTKINHKIIKEMILAWILTFPGCGLIGYIMTKIFMNII